MEKRRHRPVLLHHHHHTEGGGLPGRFNDRSLNLLKEETNTCHRFPYHSQACSLVNKL